ncbi:hypothetical protein HMPREF9015_00856 [Leptotrichia wadei F0279]|uniref:Uncharacterized protein n=1 Tax=Leptotrichia wadei (strain F0279) TaxID=888055 RepID=U2Q729_LEPWF|nr:hypothetical protein HMPREF9015_00856 [Leptotrichia wadei F0279]
MNTLFKFKFWFSFINLKSKIEVINIDFIEISLACYKIKTIKNLLF